MRMKKANQYGGKRVADKDLRKYTAQTTLTEAEANWVARKANDGGVTISAFLRQLVLGVMRDDGGAP